MRLAMIDVWYLNAFILCTFSMDSLSLSLRNDLSFLWSEWDRAKWRDESIACFLPYSRLRISVCKIKRLRVGFKTTDHAGLLFYSIWKIKEILMYGNDSSRCKHRKMLLVVWWNAHFNSALSNETDSVWFDCCFQKLIVFYWLVVWSWRFRSGCVKSKDESKQKREHSKTKKSPLSVVAHIENVTYTWKYSKIKGLEASTMRLWLPNWW